VGSRKCLVAEICLVAMWTAGGGRGHVFSSTKGEMIKPSVSFSEILVCIYDCCADGAVDI